MPLSLGVNVPAVLSVLQTPGLMVVDVYQRWSGTHQEEINMTKCEMAQCRRRKFTIKVIKPYGPSKSLRNSIEEHLQNAFAVIHVQNFYYYGTVSQDL